MNVNAKAALALAIPAIGMFVGAMMLRGPKVSLGSAHKRKKARKRQREDEARRRNLKALERLRVRGDGGDLYERWYRGLSPADKRRADTVYDGFAGVKVDGQKGKPGFRVSITEEELDCFRRRWPTGELRGLESVMAEFDRNGDLVDLECNGRGGSCEKWDGSALLAVVDDMQCAGESRLGIKDRCHSDEWLHCMRD